MALLQIQKRFMAMAGVVMSVFLVFHMLTSLTLLSSTQAQQFFEWYTQPWIRWPILVLFIAALALHIIVAVRIRKQNFQARRVGYAKHDKFHVPAPLVSISIVLLFLFIVFHLCQSLSLKVEGDIQMQVMQWFASPLITLIYLGGVGILAMHLLHSLMNVMQSLAITSKQYVFAFAVGVGLLLIGFAAVPVMFFWSQL